LSKRTRKGVFVEEEIREALAMFLGLRTVIYPAVDLASSKTWFSQILGAEPYLDTYAYVGFSVNGYELALDPNADPDVGPITYWAVEDVDAAFEVLTSAGADPLTRVENLGEQIRVARFRIPNGGGIMGVIENPHQAANDQHGASNRRTG
jgi:hypothetical protein